MYTGKYHWLKVTKDKYELPIAVADTSDELAAILGVSGNTVRKAVWRGRFLNANSAYIAIPREEGGD